MPQRLSQGQYVALLAGISVAVLVLGVLLKPKELPQPTISMEETLRLRKLTERRNLENLAVYYSEVVGGIQPGLVWLNELGTTGLVWNQQGLIVTAGPEGPAPKEVTALSTNGNLAVTPQLLSGYFRIGSLTAPNTERLQPVHRSPASALAPGTGILQVARQAGGNYLFAPGVYGGLATEHCGAVEIPTVQSNLPLNEAALGGGLFDVDGNLLAMVVRCGGHYAAMLPAAIEQELVRANTLDGELLRAFGLRVSPLDDSTKAYFHADKGVWVAEVVDGQAADAAGLQPGDVIAAVGAMQVSAPENLRALLKPQDPPGYDLEIRRSRRLVKVHLMPHSEATQGVVLVDEAQGYRVEVIAPGSRAERGSLHAGDQVLLLDSRRPAGLAAVQKVLAGGTDPVFVTLRRGSHRLGVLLP